MPTALGYRMPAEWEPHAATWLAWPHNTVTWPDQLAQVQDIFLRMIAAVHEHETVHLFVHDTATAAAVREHLHRSGVIPTRVVLHERPTADAWLRDSGPIFLTAMGASQPVAISDWQFNAWGSKYADLLADNDLPQYIATFLDIPRFEPGIVLEGGSIDVNGRGSCLTTEQCLLNPNRNPHMQRSDLERCLHDYLGVRHVIWLGQGIAGDDTDGHVDDIARFIDPTTVVCVWKKILTTSTLRFCKTTIDACKPPPISMAAPYRSYHSPCLALSGRHPHACQPAMPIFTLPMGLYWSPPTTILMTSAP